MRPRRRQPIRLPHPLDSPGKNTEVGFPSPMHESEKWKWSCSVMSYSSQPHGLQPTRLLHPWDFPGKNTGVGCQRGPGYKWMVPAWKGIQCSPEKTRARSVCTTLCYAKSFQSCPTLCDPIDGSHQAPPSLGFSRQEDWSGLPFPSPNFQDVSLRRKCKFLSSSAV